MKICEIKDNKKFCLPLLLLGDEQESMIERYLDCGDMYVLDEDDEVKAVCVVSDEGNGILEIKNIAVLPNEQRKGLGRAMIKFIAEKYKPTHSILRAGTGDSPLTVPFYEKCGFKRAFIVKNFFVDNYDHAIFEDGVQLKDMVYFELKI